MISARCIGLGLLLIGTLPFGVAQTPRKLERRGFFGVGTKADAKGLQVTLLVPGGTGDMIGIQSGDVIERVNGSNMKTPADLVAMARRLLEGSKVSVQIFRKGGEQILSGKMASRQLQTDPDLDVVYDEVTSKGRRIRVIVIKPKGPGPFPAFFLIGGIGAYSVDGNFANVLYGNILDPVAHAGYVTVRIDKPGQGDSQGPAYPDLTFLDELDAYVHAAKFAQSLPYVDKNRVALYGHSMGGAFAPLVSTQVPVKAVIVNGTLFEPFTEYMLENSRRQSELAQTPEDQLNDDQTHFLAACHYLFDQNLTLSQTRQRHFELAPFLKSNFGPGETYSGVGIPFFRELNRTNLAAAWKTSHGDTLAIYGENDFLSGRADHVRLVDWVNHLRPGTAKLIILQNTDHVFKQTTSMLDSFTNWSKPGKPNPAIVSTLLDYLKTELG